MDWSAPRAVRIAAAVAVLTLLVAACAEMSPVGSPTDTGVQALGSDTEPNPLPQPSVADPTTTTTLPEFDDPILETPVDPAPPFDESPVFTYEVAPEVDAYVGRIRIPRANVDHEVIEGVARAQLDVSPGHMPRTAMPGQYGNAVVAGHRTTYGAPFYDLDLLVPGDEIFIDTGIGTHTYEVVSTEIVLPNAMWTVQHRAGGWLTLIACHPKGSNAQRIIVFGKLVSGPNHDVISEIFEGPYDPPADPGTPPPQPVREVEPTDSAF